MSAGTDLWAPVETLSLPAKRTAPSLARVGVRSLLESLPEFDRDTVELLISELVTNAVQHSGMSEREAVELTL
jgi:anti-sigma regulatory factor (Ser/Thr protein kinase)